MHGAGGSKGKGGLQCRGKHGERDIRCRGGVQGKGNEGIKGSPKKGMCGAGRGSTWKGHAVSVGGVQGKGVEEAEVKGCVE